MPDPRNDPVQGRPPRPRRPDYRGERAAVLIRLPVEVAERLRDTADGLGTSVSETAAGLIAAGLGKRTSA